MSSNRLPSPLRLLVDLTPLAAGGANGGIKPFLRETLRALGRQEGAAVHLTCLTSSPAHAEVRTWVRVVDELICVRDTGVGTRPSGDETAPRERFWPDPPADLAARLGTDVLFSPLTWTEFHCPGVPLVSTVADLLHRDYPWTLRPAENVHREGLYADVLRLTDRFQCISDHTRARLRHHYEVPPGRTFRTHVAVHEHLVDGTGPGAPGAFPYFFYPANAWVHKNHEVLLLAYHLYRQETRRHPTGGRPWPLVLTGHEDSRMAELRALADTLGLIDGDEGVRFLGYVNPARLGELWRGAGALVFPSLHEGFGIPLTEAMAQGVPILCGTEGAIPEVTADAALAVDVRNPVKLAGAMTRMAADGALRQDLVTRGQANLARFSLVRETAGLLDALREAVSRPARATAKGWWPEDGWTAPVSLFGPLTLPTAAPGGRGRVRLRLRAMPVPRRVRLREGPRPVGAWDVPPGQAVEFTAVVRGGRGPLVVEVPDNSPPVPGEARALGVWVDGLTLAWDDAAGGNETSLLPEKSFFPPDPS